MAKKNSTIAATKAAAPGAAPAPSATATRRGICVCVAPAQRAAVEQVFTTYDTQHGTQFSGPDGVLVPCIPGWDGFSDPQPPTYCYFASTQGELAMMAQFEEACEQAALFGLKWYEMLTVAEAGDPCNSVDSIYAGGAYNPSLPMDGPFAGIAAWALDVPGQLPPRDNLP